MIRFQALGVRFTLSLLSLLAPLLCVRLGMKLQPGALILALSLHESAHILAARLLRVQIIEIHLMPIGGSARMENPYGISALQLFLTAISGPLANLLIAFIFAALAHWNFLDPIAAARHISINLTLFFFNLLPALPLDGGRMLYCLLQTFLGRRKALKAGISIGRALAIVLMIFAFYGFCISGRLNLCLILVAIFILVSSHDELDAMLEADAKCYSMQENSPLPVRFYQLECSTPVLQALHLLHPKEAGWFILINKEKPVGFLNGTSILSHFGRGGSPQVSLDRLPYFQFSIEDQPRISSIIFNSSAVSSGASKA